MTSPVLVTGGTGRLGRSVVRRLRTARSEVYVLTRRHNANDDGITFRNCDLITGKGVDTIVPSLRKQARLPVIPAPAGFEVQPVDSDEVAARLVELTLGAPAGRVPDLADPEVTSWAGLLADYLRFSGRRRWVIPVLIPGTRAIRADGLLPPERHYIGHRAWEQFLASTRTATSVRLFDRLYFATS